MFNKRKSAIEENNLIFKQPKIKHSREIKTHLRERTEVEKILYLFSNPIKRKTVFRMILSLPQSELDKNIYMISDLVLKTLIQDKNIDVNFYSVLSKLLRSSNSECLKLICGKYLKAQLCFDPNYYGYLDFLIRHFKRIIVEEKESIANYIQDKKMKERILNLENFHTIETKDYKEEFYFIRNRKVFES